MNEYDPLDPYSFGMAEEQARQQEASDRASTGCLLAVFRFFYLCFKYFFLILPSILCSVWILEWLKKPFTKTTRWDYFGWLCSTVFVLECIIFFLKGWQLSLRRRNNLFWVPIVIICLLYCFVLPVCMFQVLIVEQFKRTPGTNISMLTVLAWVSGAILGWLIYRRYNLQQDTAPKLFLWAFRIGRAL